MRIEPFAVVAFAPNGTSMVASVHASEQEADTEAERQRNRRPMWSFSVEIARNAA